MSDVASRLTVALAERYRVERELGAGGMATVYLAHDVRHDRPVALKVLRPELAAVVGAQRFLAEIRTTANLQHPHILPLHDSGEVDGTVFYVMPYVTGESLRDRLAREKQLPVDDAVRIASEVADALGAAHARGIIHRDIKPENILLQDGHALVADFGIALAASNTGGARMTETGMSLGTPMYMSPEQAMGERTLDARSDVYALGAVLYEMLTGDPPFTGSTAQAIVAKVLTSQPERVTTLRSTVPVGVAETVHAALQKLPADRPASARAFAEGLKGAGATRGATPAAMATSVRGAPRWVLAGWVAVAAASLAVAAWALSRGGSGPAPAAVQAVVEPPGGNADLSRFAVSPDGARFAFCTDEGIALRDSAQRDYRTLPSTERCESPAFGPDGRWIAYHADGRLFKVPVAGGTPVRIIASDSLLASRVTWGADGTIAFETGERIGVVTPAGTVRILPNGIGGSPRVTADGKGLFYVDVRAGSHLMYYDLARDTSVLVLPDAIEGELLPSGHLLYGSSLGGLYVTAFDRRTYRATGSPIPVAPDVAPAGTVSPFVLTASGMLAFRTGKEPEMRIVVWHPSGVIDTLPLAPRTLAYVRFAPDGKQLAVTVGLTRGTNRHVALYDFGRGTLTRFTMDGGGHAPVWSPDGTRLAYTREGPGTNAEDIAIQPVDGSEPPRMLPPMPIDQHTMSWPDDSTLVFTSNETPRTVGGTAGGGQTMVIDPRTGQGLRAYLAASYGESEAAVSPDGQWIAYTSRESGRNEIQVRRFTRPEPTGKWRVTSAGGQRARWAPDGRTLYFVNNEGTAIQAVPIAPGADFTAGPVRTVMKVEVVGQAWDVDRATGRIAVAAPVVSPGVRIVIQQGWLADVERRLAREGGSR